MAEKYSQGTEKYNQPTDIEQFGEIAHERNEAIKALHERESKKQKSPESEREIIAEAEKLAQDAENKNATHNHSASPAERRHGPLNKHQLDISFASQMKYAEAEMRPVDRLVSRVIHAKPIEKTGDALGKTVARPNAMLSGSIAAFLGVTILYFISKYFGFELSGFETIACFIGGWIIGILYDYFSVMIRGHDK